jgi:small ligand-binding sensory domain FIST
MSVRIGCGLSTLPDARQGSVEAAMLAREALEGSTADLALVFASGTHLAAPETTLEGVYEGLAPDQLVGCGAGGVLGVGREVEGATAVAVWAAALGDGSAKTFHARAEEGEEGPYITGLPDADAASGVVLLPDPYSFPTDGVLSALRATAPGVPVLGGLSSARTLDGSPALFLGDEVMSEGAVGVVLEGVDVHPCVSQGAAPLGPELTITAADGHVIQELAGKPALVKLREVIEGLSDGERELIADGLLVGLVIDGGKPDYEQGDFLVRGLIGADPDAGYVAVGARVSPGQVLRLHARDAESADRDLRDALAVRRQELGAQQPAGALVFTCNGRGREMFGVADHDAGVLARGLDGAPAAGFFAAGEIGPVGGESFLHGFTATIAVFAR